MIRLEMKNYNDDINREAVKISALSSGKIDIYEYLTGEDMLLSDQRRVIEQGKFTYSHLGKALVKQTKAIEDQGKNQIKAIEDQGKQFNEPAEERSSEFRNLEKRITPDNLIHKYKTEGRSPKDFRI